MPKLMRGALAAAFAAGALVALRPVADMDFHWHLAQGRAWLAGELPAARDPFTHLPTVAAPSRQSWGADLLFAVTERAFGVAGVRLLLAAVVGLAWALVLRLGAGSPPRLASGILALGVFAAASALRLRARPEVFSLAAPFALLLVAARPTSWRRDGLLLLIAAAWSNLHPAAILAPALAAGALSVQRVTDRARAALAALAGTCAHPDGPLALGAFAGDTEGLGAIISEWQPLWRLDAARFAPEWAVFGAGLLASVLAALRFRRAHLGHFVLVLLGTLLAARAVRFLPFLALPALAAIDLWRDVLVATAKRRAALAAAGLALVAAYPLKDAAVSARRARQAGLAPFADLYAPNYPVAAARFLESVPLEGNLFHPERWGGYLMAQLHPRYRTAADGRVNLYGAALAGELLRFGDAAVRRDLVLRLGLEILVLPPETLPRAEWADPGAPSDPARRWLPVHGDATAIVFVDLQGPHAARNLAALRAPR